MIHVFNQLPHVGFICSTPHALKSPRRKTLVTNGDQARIIFLTTWELHIYAIRFNYNEWMNPYERDEWNPRCKHWREIELANVKYHIIMNETT